MAFRHEFPPNNRLLRNTFALNPEGDRNFASICLQANYSQETKEDVAEHEGSWYFHSLKQIRQRFSCGGGAVGAEWESNVSLELRVHDAFVQILLIL